MNRRQLLSTSFLSGIGISLVGSTIWLNIGPGSHSLNIQTTLARLNALIGKKIEVNGEWQLNQIFQHLTQSIHYSMVGYPQHKSETFKSTLGQIAFSAFKTKGKMRHGLSEVIPGAAELDKQLPAEQALLQLKTKLLEFEQHTGQLQSHFAYGDLSKDDYLIAHIMHINNHLEAFV